MEYTYSIASDTLNAACAPSKLHDEITQSSITIGVDRVDTNGDELKIVFVSAISTEEQTTLTALVGAHDGQQVVEPNEPKEVSIGSYTDLGVPLIAIKKPDGQSRTVISHNYCDNTTWPATDNSLWQIAPPPGKIWNVLRAEVQFSHDIEMATLTPTAEAMSLEVMAGGFAVDSKLFPSIASIFDLGNDHFSTPAGVILDGNPGMTTVRFDYQDTIVLRSSLAMSMDFQLVADIELGGTHCTVSAIVEEIDE